MVRIIFYNIEYLEGIKGEKLEYLQFWKRFIHPKRIEIKIASALKKYKPNIVSLTEVGGHSLLEDDYFLFLKKQLGMKYHVKRVKYQINSMAWIKFVPFLNNQSNGVLSKKKITHSEVLYLKEGMKRAVIKVEFRVPQKLTLLLVHLALGKNTRKKQIGELADITRRTDGPLIIAGDFNTFEGEEEIESLLKETGLKHNFKLHKGRIFTYPTYHPRRRLDYVLTSKDIKVKEYKVLDIGFSDHLPILVDFELN